MYMVRIYALILSVYSATVCADSDLLGFKKCSNVYQHTNSVLMFADYLTTLDIRRHPELNEKMYWAGSGELKRSRINTYFALKALLHYWINKKYNNRNLWNLTQIGLQVYAIENNLSIGLRIKF